ALLDQLEGSLVGQVYKVKGPQRERLIALRNETLKLTKEGDLPLAREKVAQLREGLERNALLTQLQGPLVDQIAHLKKGPEREQLVALLNEAIKLTKGGDLQLAKQKAVQLVALLLKLTKGGDLSVDKETVVELEEVVASPPPDPKDETDEKPERDALLVQLEGPLVAQVTKVKGPKRGELVALLNDALKLTKEGDLEGAKQKAAQLKKELGEAETPEALLVRIEGSLLDQVTKVKGPERQRLIALRNETLKLTKEDNLPHAREKVAQVCEPSEENTL